MDIICNYISNMYIYILIWRDMVPDFPPRFLGVTSCNNPTLGPTLQCHLFLGFPSSRFGLSLRKAVAPARH